MTDPSMWLCLQRGLFETDEDPPAPIVSHDPGLVLGPIRVNVQIREVWAPHLPYMWLFGLMVCFLQCFTIAFYYTAIACLHTLVSTIQNIDIVCCAWWCI